MLNQQSCNIIFIQPQRVNQKLYDFYCTHAGKELSEDEVKEAVGLNNKLIEEIAKSIGYKEEIVTASIKKPYKPDGMVKAMQSQAMAQENYNKMLSSFTRMADRQMSKSEQQEGIYNKENSNG